MAGTPDGIIRQDDRHDGEDRKFYVAFVGGDVFLCRPTGTFLLPEHLI